MKNEKKHFRESHLLLTNRQEISAYFTVLCCFFRVGHEQVLYCGCLPQWRQEKTGSQLLLKSDDRTKWQIPKRYTRSSQSLRSVGVTRLG